MKTSSFTLLFLILFQLYVQQQWYGYDDNFRRREIPIDAIDIPRDDFMIQNPNNCSYRDNFSPKRFLPWWPWGQRCRLLYVYIRWWPRPQICYIWACNVNNWGMVFYVHYCYSLYWRSNQYRVQAPSGSMSSSDGDILMSTNINDVQKLTGQSFDSNADMSCQQVQSQVSSFESQAEAKRQMR